ncbi:MAG TPA: hypothetical protein VJU86_16915 [Pyrinomonadaceae bacterium]|nr:hypothetical protein [Pyrinomonadaceae bacterium]
MQSWLRIRFREVASGKPEAEGMTATKADVFGPVISNLVDCEEVAKQHARQRMPDQGEASLFFDERVSTSARVFSRFGSRIHNMDAMAQEAAGIVHSLFKLVLF